MLTNTFPFFTGTDAETLSAHIYEPSGTQGEAVIVATGSDTYTVSFLAKEMGVYNVTIKNQGQTIPGCPLQYTVGPLGQGGCERIQVWGQGLQTALANVPGIPRIFIHFCFISTRCFVMYCDSWLIQLWVISKVCIDFILQLTLIFGPVRLEQELCLSQ